MRNTFIYIITALAITACDAKKAPEEAAEVPMTPMEDTATSEWITLFDGTDASGWRGYNMDSLPEGWVVEDGTLKSLGQGGDIGGDIVYGERPFDNFELSLEWKISEGGNSGIFYHVQEGEYEVAYEHSPEYQIIDDNGFESPLEDWQKLGADYAMYPANPEEKIVKPAGEWNTSKIIFTEENVEYWLNGKKVVQYVPWTADWNERKNAGKWKDFPDYGKYKSGLIGLQDHGSFIWFRNIKVREL